MVSLSYKSKLIILLALLLVSIVSVKANAAIVFSNDLYYQTELNIYNDDSANAESGIFLETKEFEEFIQRKNECSIYVTNPQEYFDCLEYQ